MPISITQPDYHVDDPCTLSRWMCPSCGLIFDYRDDEYGEPRIEGWYDPRTGEVDAEVYCPRCGTSFNNDPLVAIEIAERGLRQPSETTFFVEDTAHRLVVQAIAEELGKRVSIDIQGNAQQVETLFAFSELHGGWAHCYFLVDGDNKPCRHRDSNNFIHLDRYCIENYLLDLEIWAMLSNKTVNQLREDILDLVQDWRHEITRGYPLLELFFDKLGVHEIEALLVYIDASRLILPRLLKGINVSKEDFITKYVAHAHSASRMEDVLPGQIVEIMEELPGVNADTLAAG